MLVDSILTTLGSVASIGSLPLAIYLYLRSKEARYLKIRADIAGTLSNQIGDGTSLSRFEIESVIAAKLRETRLKRRAIQVSDMVEDLVSQTIASPMLEKERKKEIIHNLRRLHQTGQLEIELERYRKKTSELLEELREARKTSGALGPEDGLAESREIEREAELMRAAGFEIVEAPEEPARSTFFGRAAALVTAIAAILVSLVDFQSLVFSPETQGFLSSLDFKIVLSVFASILGVLFTAIRIKRASANPRSN